MATYYVINAGGNLNAAGTFSTVSAKNATRVGGAVLPTNADTVIFDDYSGNCSLNASNLVALKWDFNSNGAYAGQLDVSTASSKITLSGDIIFSGSMTFSGSASTITWAAGVSPTITFNGATWPGTWTMVGASTPPTYTYTDTVRVSGLFQSTSAGVTISANGITFYLGGSVTVGASTGMIGSGATRPVFVLNGTGTISSGNAGANFNNIDIQINTAGTITFGNLSFSGGGSITYITAGSIVVGTGTVTLNGNFTFSLGSSCHFYNLAVLGTATLTLGADIYFDGSKGSGNGNLTMSGAYNIYCSDFAQNSTRSDKYVSGQYVYISTSITILVTGSTTLSSVTSSSATNIVFNGAETGLKVAGPINFTDVTVTCGSARAFWVMSTGNLVRCSGIYKFTPADFPATSDVWNGVSYAAAALTGAKRASSIANCSAGNVKSGVVIDDVTGSYAGGGSQENIPGYIS